MATTYTELGQRLGVNICTGCALTHHDTGFWGLRVGTPGLTFHWSERAMRRTSIRNFVWRLSAQMTPDRPHGTRPEPSWLRYWRRVSWAKDALRTLHVRLPASAWDTQRATLRALLAVPPAGAGLFFDDPVEEAREITRRAAWRWAKKPVDPGAADDYDV